MTQPATSWENMVRDVLRSESSVEAPAVTERATEEVTCLELPEGCRAPFARQARPENLTTWFFFRSSKSSRVIYVPRWAIAFDASVGSNPPPCSTCLVVINAAACPASSYNLWCAALNLTYEGTELRLLCFAEINALFLKMEREIVIRDGAVMRKDDAIIPIDSRLLGVCSTSTTDLKSMVLGRFSRFAARVSALMSRDLPPSRAKRERSESADGSSDSSQSNSGAGPAFGSCVVCLKSFGETERVQCRLGACGALSCKRCNSKCRKLCPICDRSAMNRQYACQSCGLIVRLHDYGHRCDTCMLHVLCRKCHCNRRECRKCECVTALQAAASL